MSSLLTKIATAARRPRIGMEFLGWTAKRAAQGGMPTRVVHGVTLGNFNGFSEYHSVIHGLSHAEKAFIGNHPFNDGVVIDVGANLGLLSLLLSKRFPRRRIVAFEPSPTTFSALKSNVARNMASNIECHAMAITDSIGHVAFATREHARANASIDRSSSAQPRATIEVACTTLDAFCQANAVDRISLLKVDVEGFETLVFSGADTIFSKSRPNVVYFEVCPGLSRAAGFDPAQPAVLLADRGYGLYRFGPIGEFEPVKPAMATDVRRMENWIAVDAQ